MHNSVTALAHYVDVKSRKAVLRSVLLDTLYSESNGVLELEFRDRIELTFGVLVTPFQVEEALAALLDEGEIVREDSGIIRLSEGASEKINKLVKGNAHHKKQAWEEWVKREGITDSLESSCEALDTYIKTVFVRHGASSYSFLTNQASIEKFELDTIEREVLSSFAK